MTLRPFGALMIGMAQLQDLGILSGGAKNLHAHRQGGGAVVRWANRPLN